VKGLDGVRSAVVAALVDGVAAVGLPAGSVHAYPPDELALPAVWLSAAFGLRPADPRTIVAEVSVIIAVDGAEPAQLAALDDLEAAAWVALELVGSATLAVPTVIDVGGPTVHAVTMTADVDVDVRTLCPPTLEAAGLAN